MKRIKASEFKAKCLSLMDEVERTGEELVITKNGRPVSKLVPVEHGVPTLFGRHAGEWQIAGDLLEPLDEAWDAEAC